MMNLSANEQRAVGLAVRQVLDMVAETDGGIEVLRVLAKRRVNDRWIFRQQFEDSLRRILPEVPQ